MTVIILERVPTSVRGELTRWMLEIHAGVFVGNLSAIVRDLLWEYVCDKMRDGAGALVYHTNSEQNFDLRFCGKTNRRPRDFDGLRLMQIPS
jgi:CRISPR-associated protein Cas2